jgi:hypothetical protein
MVAMFPSDPWNVTEPLSGSRAYPSGAPTTWSVPSRVPSSGGDEQPANDTPAQSAASAERAVNGTRPAARFGLAMVITRSGRPRAP